MATVRQSVNDDGVGIVVLADPERRNALRHQLSEDLRDAVGTALAQGARAVVLAAEPPVFCAGGSLDELLEPKAPLEELYAGFFAVAHCPVPTIAAVGGPCIGAGVNLPLACDVIVATPAARFDCRWLDAGVHPGGGHLRRLTDRAGRQAAAAMVLCGEHLDGEDAAPRRSRLALRARGRAARCCDRTRRRRRATRSGAGSPGQGIARRNASPTDGGRCRRGGARRAALVDVAPGLPRRTAALAGTAGATR